MKRDSTCGRYVFEPSFEKEKKTQEFPYDLQKTYLTLR